MIFLDTSSAIHILNGNESLKNVIDKFRTDKFGITSPTIFELYHGIYKLRFLKKKIPEQNFENLLEDLEDFIKQLHVFSLNERAANLGAKIHMELKGKGQEIDVFDCLIAAIIITNDFKQIITRNQKHFEKIKELVLYTF